MNDNVIEMFPAENLSFLSEMHLWGIEVIRAIQKIQNPALTSIVKFITALGTENLYLPLILFIFWWIDEKQGLRFGILIIVSAWINSFMKNLWKQPRPFHLDPSLGLAMETSYGAPSGHAQMSLSFWIPMAAWLTGAGKGSARRKYLIWGASVFFILLIGFTRLYLGVHFPTDLFAGWIIGGVILAAFFLTGPRLEKFFDSASTRTRSITAAAIALIMNGFLPREGSLAALFLGFCLGYALMKQRFPFHARDDINGKKPGLNVMIFRCLTGFVGIAVIYLGLRLILPGEASIFSGIPLWGEASPIYELGRFIRYGFIGFWASAGAPWLFRQMGLASRENS